MDTNWDHLSVCVRFTQTSSYDPNENPSDCVLSIFTRDNCVNVANSDTEMFQLHTWLSADVKLALLGAL